MIEPSCYHRTRFPVFAALLGYLIVPATPSGWQIVQMITAVPILMLLWWRCAPGIAALVDRAGPVHAGTSDIGNSMTDGGFVLPDAVTFTNPLDWFVGTTDL